MADQTAVIVSLPRLTTQDALIQWSRHLVESLQDVMSGKRLGQISPGAIIGGVGTGTGRGTMWFTGKGPPGVISGSLPGDMYLDTVSGNIYVL